MPQDIEKLAEEVERVKSLIYTLAHGPYAARHQAALADAEIEALTDEYQGGTLEPAVMDWLLNHAQTLRAGRDALNAFADQFDADYPILRARPE